jgi:hypothetical protein
MISRAAQEAGSVSMFCELLDERSVPLPSSLRNKGGKSWVDAHSKRDCQSIIRGIKRRHKSPS